MSEKLKPNFTHIPNVILDEMMRMLAPGATKVLFAICRFTYGWGKQADRISLSQLQETTGMARGSVARSIKELGDVVTVTPGDPSQNLASEYRLNIEISDGDLVSLRDQSLVSKRDQASLSPSLIKRPSKDNQRNKSRFASDKQKLRLGAGAEAPGFPSHQRSGKLTRPDPAALAAFDAFYRAYPRHVGRKPAMAAWLKLNPDAEVTNAIMVGAARYAEQVNDTEARFILHPATWLNQERWTDEIPPSGNGHAKPVQVKDLGDGFVEVDGRRVERRIYEKRYAKT